jgi:hypothetical protein
MVFCSIINKLDLNSGEDSKLNIKNTPSTDIYFVTESVLDWLASGYSTEQFAKVKNEYFELAGKVFSDDLCFDVRMDYFLEYFVYQRVLEMPIDGIEGLSPYELFARFKNNESVLKIDGFRHSIFEIEQVNHDKVHLKDLLLEENFVIKYHPAATLLNMLKKELFQGFIFFSEGDSYLGKGLLFHPAEVRRLIKKEIKILFL